ncbi:MAG TPA: hypothetical protein DDW83_09440, partial [Peptococcaceae bacterium]|nr:hypothetical protein [Peptococcaceae bacterium]
LVLSLVLCAMLMCCGCSPAAETENGGEEAPPVQNEGETNGEAGTEDSTMSRINIFETGIMELTAEDVDSNGAAVSAYAVKDYVEKNFASDPADPVAMQATDGYSASTTVDEFMKHYITMEGDSAPLLVGPDLAGELSVKFLQYLKTANESICFVADTLDVEKVFSDLGMVEADTYKFVASDGFSVDVSADDIADCT